MVATEELAELFLRRSQVKHLRTLKSRPMQEGMGFGGRQGQAGGF